MGPTVEALLAFMGAHTTLAYVVIVLAATLEAVLVVGLFVPSTPILVGAGALVGMGALPLLPVLAASTVGAVLGDALSYWMGRRWGGHLANTWPLDRYPGLIARGEDFFRRWGGWSVFLGRFVPALKSVVPGIAGMAGMPPTPFAVVNLVSAVVWSAAHILPGAGLVRWIASIPREAALPALAGTAVLVGLGLALRRFVLARMEEGASRRARPARQVRP